MRRLSHSQMSVYTLCARKWWYQYQLELEREASSIEMDLGTIMGEFLALYHMGNPDGAFDLVKAKSFMLDAATQELLNGVIANYIKFDANHLTSIPDPCICDIMIPECELFSQTFVDKGFELYGKADFLCKQGDKITIVENKLTKQAKSLVYFELNAQAKLYHLMASEMFKGCHIDVLFNVIQKAYPHKPKVNKDGTISRAKISTTPLLYRDTIIENGQNPEDYIDILTTLPNTEYVVRYPLMNLNRKRTLVGLSSLVNEMSLYLKRMPHMETSFLCDNCGYSDICTMGQEDYDAVMNYINNSEWQQLYRRR